MRDLDWMIISELNKNPNLTQVSKILYMTQPSLTKRLKNIEEELDVEIVERTPRGLILTEAGIFLGEKADAYLRFREVIIEELDNIKQNKKMMLNIGSAYTFSKYDLRKVLDPFADSYPDLKIRISNKQSDVLYKMLLEGAVDAAFVRGDYRQGVNCIPLDETYGYLITRDPVDIWKLPGMNRVTYQTSGKTTEILDAWWQDWFGKKAYKEGGSAGYIDFALNSVVGPDDYILCFLPPGAEEDRGLTLTPLYMRNGTQVTRRTWFLYRKEKRISRILEEFIAYVEKIAREQENKKGK